MAAYDTPRYRDDHYHYQRQSFQSDSMPPCLSVTQPFLDYVHAGSPKVSTLRFEDVLPLYKSFRFDLLRMNDIASITAMQQVPTLVEDADEDQITRAAFDRLATRVAVLLAFVQEGRPLSSYPRNPLRPSPMNTVDDMDVFTYAMSISILCFGPVVPLVLNCDTRALILFYQFYHCMNELLRGSSLWWCLERSAVLEVKIRNELRRRGISVCLRDPDAMI